MVGRVEVRAEAPGDLAAVLQLRRQGARGCGGEEQTSGVAPSRCSERRPCFCRTSAQLKEVAAPLKTAGERRRFRVGSGWGEMFVCKIPVCLLLQQKPPLG